MTNIETFHVNRRKRFAECAFDRSTQESVERKMLTISAENWVNPCISSGKWISFCRFQINVRIALFSWNLNRSL